MTPAHCLRGADVRFTLGAWLRDRRRARELGRAGRFRLGPLTVFVEGGHPAEALVYRLGVALDLFARADPVGFRCLRRSLDTFYIRASAGAEYWRDRRICVLSAAKVAIAPAHEIALDVVHELAHARVHQRGIPWRPALFERIERLCVRREIAFCNRLAKLGYDVDARIRWYEDRLKTPLYVPEFVRSRRAQDRMARDAHRIRTTDDPADKQRGDDPR